MLNIHKPVLLIDVPKVRQNIGRMAEKAVLNKARFRPHFKTHQSAGIGEWFREQGITAITVSSVSMAKYFARYGWEDITIAFPVNLREIADIQELAAQVNLGLLVDSVEVVRALVASLSHPVQVWLAVNTGMGREGLDWDASDPFVRLINEAQKSPYVTVAGLLAHFGQTYAVQGTLAVSRVYHDSMGKLVELKKELSSRTGVKLEISIGDTPSGSMVDDLSQADEIRPGNFVFYDIHQLKIGACDLEDIAAGVACPVVSVYPERETILLYGGAVHLSKDFLPGLEGSRIFGNVAPLIGNNWGEWLPEAVVTSLSQEHGLVRAPRSVCEGVSPGDILVVFPAHICLAVSALHRYLTLDNQVVDCFVE